MCANQSEKGSGFWKLNLCLLEYGVYLDKINNLIQNELEKEYESNVLRWEMIKLEVRGTTIQYASRKKKAKNCLAALEKKLNEVNEQIVEEANSGRDNSTPLQLSQNTVQQLTLLQGKIDQLIEIKAKGAIVRSRADWIQLAEKPTSYF